MTVVYVPGTQEGHSLGEAGRAGLEGTWEEGHCLSKDCPPADPDIGGPLPDERL